MWGPSSAAVAWNAAVGIVWGITNPLIALGSAEAERKEAEARASGRRRGFWSALIGTPLFWAPQLVNWAGSAAFAAGLSSSGLATAPLVANATCLATNAVADALLLRHHTDLRLLLPGLVMIAVGAFICAS